MTTARRVIERVVSAAVCQRAPIAGDLYTSPTGASLLQVSRVRRITNDAGGALFRLFTVKVDRAAMPAGAEVLPWPRKAAKAKTVPTLPIKDGPARPIVTLAAKAQKERRRVLDIRRADLAMPTVPDAQVASGKVVPGTWRDPSDFNVQRRTAKEGSWLRAVDPINVLVEKGTLDRHQVYAATRFRREVELGSDMRGGPDRSGAHAGFGPTSVSEIRLQHAERLRITTAALGRLADTILCICIKGETIGDYADRQHLNRRVVVGMLIASVMRLQDHYEIIDRPKRRLAHDATAPVAAE